MKQAVDVNGTPIKVGDRIRRIKVETHRDCQQWGMPEGTAKAAKYLGGESLGEVTGTIAHAVATFQGVFAGRLVEIEPAGASQ